MGTGLFLGEFEHLVLLAVLQLNDDAHAIQLRSHIEQSADSEVSNQIESNMAEELPVDTRWDDLYPSNTGSASSISDGDYDPLANRSESQTLTDHLLWQLNVTPMAESDRFIAGMIIDAVDDNGLLTIDTEEIWSSACNAPELIDSRRHAALRDPDNNSVEFVEE